MKTRTAVPGSRGFSFSAEISDAPREVAAKAECISSISGGSSSRLSCLSTSSDSESTATKSAWDNRFFTETRCSGRTITIDVAMDISEM